MILPLAALITPGTFDDDLPKLADCDWVIEAVAENLEIKTALLTRVLPHLAPHALLTTNTSGLPISQIASVLPVQIRKRFFGTHFFNPPRYMRLLEVIPTADSIPPPSQHSPHSPICILGKQIVFAHDTPNFIANRIGIAVMFNAANLMLEQGFPSKRSMRSPAPPSAGHALEPFVSPTSSASMSSPTSPPTSPGHHRRQVLLNPRRASQARLARR